MKKNIFKPGFKLFLLGIFFLLILKIIFINNFLLISITTLYDVLIFGFLVLIYLFFDNVFVNIFYYFLFYLNFILTSFYYIYFYDVYQRNILYSISFEVVNFVFKNIISIWYIILIFLFLVVLFLFSKYSFKKVKLFFAKKYLLYLFFLIVILFFLTAFIFQGKYNFYSFYISEYIKYRDPTKTILEYNTDIPYQDLSKEFTEYPEHSIKYKNILIFIGEEWMYSDFLKEKKQNDFFDKHFLNSIYYTKHFTSNQDSRTAIFSLLTASFIPFEAYLDTTYSKYDPVIKKKKNLVSYFKENDYNTVFLVSAIETPSDIVSNFNFDKIITLDKKIYDSQEYYCSKLFVYETSCEDMAMLDDIKDVILNNEKLFFIQEFIYGHSYKHIQDKKISRTSYYSDYLNQVYSFLEAQNKIDDTLIVIVGDHGSRATSEMYTYEGFMVPFIFIAKDLDPASLDVLTSHLDFKDLLFKYIHSNNYIPLNEHVMFVGGTGSYLIGFYTKDSDFGIINTQSNKLINNSLPKQKIIPLSQEFYNQFNYLKENYK